LAHELRNPLAPIGNAVNILQVADDPKQHRAAMHIIDRQLHQLVRLVDDLMDVSRITRGKVELRHTELNFKYVIQSAIEATSPMMREKNQKLSVKIPNDSIWMNGDMTRLAQVFTNILNNASKYTPENGQIWLQVQLLVNEVNVVIEDNGEGIPAEKLDVIFDMFLQLDSSIRRLHGGLGIGLTLVKQLVIMHGGRIDVKSGGLGKGSRFSVFLPRSKMLLDGVKALTENKPVSNNENLRILVVDDNEESATTLTQLLELLGHQTECDFRGSNAVQKALQFKPQVILLDIGMPDLDGYEVCRQIKQHPELKHIFCIAQTGWGEKHHVQQARAAGFDEHLVKPVDIKKLTVILENIANGFSWPG